MGSIFLTLSQMRFDKSNSFDLEVKWCIDDFFLFLSFFALFASQFGECALGLEVEGKGDLGLWGRRYLGLFRVFLRGTSQEGETEGEAEP